MFVLGLCGSCNLAPFSCQKLIAKVGFWTYWARQSSSSGKPEPWMKLYDSYRSKWGFSGKLSHCRRHFVNPFVKGSPVGIPIFGVIVDPSSGKVKHIALDGTWSLRQGRPLKIRKILFGAGYVFFWCLRQPPLKAKFPSSWFTPPGK